VSKIQIQKVKDDLIFIEDLFRRLLKILPAFDITDEKILPYGLKPHTRSISWLVEQVITQQAKFNAKKLGIADAEFEFPDTCLHDCEIKTDSRSYFVNVKIHNMAGKDNKNDIAAVEKLYMQYSADPDYDLIYACFGVHFDNIHIRFDPDYLKLNFFRYTSIRATTRFRRFITTILCSVRARIFWDCCSKTRKALSCERKNEGLFEKQFGSRPQ
jgi:hypothetical protein